jgi:hypothetical protein
MTDIPVCGYALPTGLCREAREQSPEGLLKDRCVEHMQSRFRVCGGCAGDADGICGVPTATGHTCQVPICSECGHQEDGSHGRGGAFSAQRPVVPAAMQARRGLIAHTAAALRGMEERGLIKLPQATDEYLDRIAAVLVDDIAAATLMNVLEGMAASQVQS